MSDPDAAQRVSVPVDSSPSPGSSHSASSEKAAAALEKDALGPLNDISWAAAWKNSFLSQFWLEFLVVVLIGGIGSILCFAVFTPPLRHFIDFTAVPYNLNQQLQFLIYDAPISYHNDPGLIPSIIPIAVPLICLFGAAIFLEIINVKNRGISRRQAAWTTLYVILDYAQGFAISVLSQQASAVAVGKLRPDFLARCVPDFETTECTNSDPSSVEDARKSFFSGHASTGHYSVTYLQMYIIWNTYYRYPVDPEKYARKGCYGQWFDDIIQICSLIIMLGLWTLAWAVSCTRIIDNHHAVEDVISGVFIGTFFACFFAGRSLGRHKHAAPK